MNIYICIPTFYCNIILMIVTSLALTNATGRRVLQSVKCERILPNMQAQSYVKTNCSSGWKLTKQIIDNLKINIFLFETSESSGMFYVFDNSSMTRNTTVMNVTLDCHCPNTNAKPRALCKVLPSDLITISDCIVNITHHFILIIMYTISWGQQC